VPIGSTTFPQNTGIEVDNADQSKFEFSGSASFIILWRPPKSWSGAPWDVQSDGPFLGGSGNESGYPIFSDGSINFKRSAGGPSSTAADGGSFVFDKWQLIEIYYDTTGARWNSNEVHVYVNHVDVTRDPILTYSGGSLLRPDNIATKTKGWFNAGGDVAAVLITEDVLTSGEQSNVQDYFEGIYGYLDTPAADTTRGYTARACGFDMDRDGIVGEAEDCDLCDGETIDPDHDAVYEDIYYVDPATGGDDVTCGASDDPCDTIQYAWNTRADGNGDGQEDIICFKGTAIEEVTQGTAGVTGTYTLSASGNEQQDWSWPKDPAMLVGWDADNDQSYPPFDTDDTAILDGTGLTDPVDMITATTNATNNYLEFAHFEVRNVLYNKDGEHAYVLNCDECDYVYIHDLEITASKDSCLGSQAVTFPLWGGMRHVWWDNIEHDESGGYLWRGQGNTTGSDGPIRISNNSADFHGSDSCSTAQRSVMVIKGWGHYGEAGTANHFEMIDNHFDMRPDLWNENNGDPGLAIRIGSGMQNAHVQNNYLEGWRIALSLEAGQSGVGSTRRTDDLVFDGNFAKFDSPVYDNVWCIEAEDEGSGADHRMDDWTVQNTLCWNVTGSDLARLAYVNAGSSSSLADASLKLYHNTFCSTDLGTWDDGVLTVADSGATFDLEDIDFSGNIIGCFGAGPTNTNVDYDVDTWSANRNVYDDDGDYDWIGNTGLSLADWRTNSGGDAQAVECDPTFVSGTDRHLDPADTCAKDFTGLNLSVTADVDGDARPQFTLYDAGADEEAQGATAGTQATGAVANGVTIQ
jgi:hypothetical protein